LHHDNATNVYISSKKNINNTSNPNHDYDNQRAKGEGAVSEPSYGEKKKKRKRIPAFFLVKGTRKQRLTSTIKDDKRDKPKNNNNTAAYVTQRKSRDP